MKLGETMANLPESLRRRLSEHPLIADRLTAERPLEDVFDRVWARRWAANAASVNLDLLKCLLRQYAAVPFAEAEAEKQAAKEMESAWTGAELRVALLRLRQDGILFALRKPWGDRLLYLPSDRIELWHSVLFTEELSNLSSEEEELVTAEAGKPSRIPLSWQLLSVWADIRHRGFPLTSKGMPYKLHSSRLAAVMEVTAKELQPLFQQSLPADSLVPIPVALAIELGAELGILYRGTGSIEAGSGDELGWFGETMDGLDSLLHSLVATRYASASPGLHYASLSLSVLEPFLWYPEDGVTAAFGMTGGHPNRSAWEDWLQLATDLGWLERGYLGEERVIRWKIDPSLPSRNLADGRMNDKERGAIYIQSDLEAIVPPEVGFGDRWLLEEVGERIAMDTVSTYRLTRSSCERASRLGYTLERIIEGLERASGETLMGIARSALEDWLGGVSPVASDEGNAGGHELKRSAETIRLLARPEALRDYVLDGAIPQFKELFPGLPSIPSSWLHQSRSYHASTRKDLVERALAWRTALRIGPDGADYAFIPERLERKEDNWMVFGRIRGKELDSPSENAAIALSMDNLIEMRLELPTSR